MTMEWLYAPDGYTLARIQREFGIPAITGIIHVGAQLGGEWVYYEEIGCRNVTWIEANPAVIERLRATVEPVGHRVIEALVGDEDGKESPFNVTNIDGLSSSIFEFGTHKDFSPDMVFEKRLTLKMRTLDSLIAEHGITDVNFLVMDTQGAEGLVLKGAQGLLPQLVAVYSEYNLTQVYEGCIELPELDRMLLGFGRVKTWHGGPGWGDAIWVRDRAELERRQMSEQPEIVGGAVSGIGGTADLSPFVASESRAVDAIRSSPLTLTGVPRREGEPRVCVFVPSWNCSRWIERCLRSIAEQTRQPDSVLVIDDASTEDGYFDLCSSLLADTTWSIVRNDFNKKMPHNLWWAMREGAWHAGPGPDDVVIIVDGDDFLAPGAIERIAEVYRDPDLWLSWGSYRRDGFYKDFMPNPACDWPDYVKLSGSYRQAIANMGYHPFNHPLTFRRWLFDLLDEADFKDDQGNWFPAGYDFTLMLPLTELAGDKHGRFLRDVLYCYEEGNPQSDAKIRPSECARVHDVVRSRPVREALESRPA